MKNFASPKKEPIHSRYLIVNEQDLLWGLTVNTVGRQIMCEHESYPPTGHPTRYLFSTEKGRVLDEYQLLYIAKGKGVFQSRSCKQVEINAGNVFLLFPGEWHSYRPDPAVGWEEYWIGFQGENIDNRVRNGFFSMQKPVYYVGILEEIVQLYNQGITVAREQKVGYQQMLAGIVNHLLGLTFSLDKHSGFDNLEVANSINKAKILFAENLQQGIKPEEVAAQLLMSYSWFRRLFKEYTGFSPARYMQELRIQYAKELLTNSNMSIKEVAFNCGFENVEYFFLAFKSKTGHTPTQYREFTQGGKH